VTANWSPEDQDEGLVEPRCSENLQAGDWRHAVPRPCRGHVVLPKVEFAYDEKRKEFWRRVCVPLTAPPTENGRNGSPTTTTTPGAVPSEGRGQ
jgi:hypothetical protein